MVNKKARPLHPFPLLIQGVCSHDSISPITTAERNVLTLLRRGNKIIFDIHQKRGLVYRFCRGIETIMEISVRMLSSLVRRGEVVPVGREGRLVHFALAGTNTSWYDPE